MKFNNLFKHQQLLVYMYVKEASHNYGRFNIRYDADKVVRLGITRNRKSLNQLLYTLKKAWCITNDKHSGYWRIVDFIMCEKLVNSLDDFSYDMFNNMNQQPKVFSEDISCPTFFKIISLDFSFCSFKLRTNGIILGSILNEELLIFYW